MRRKKNKARRGCGERTRMAQIQPIFGSVTISGVSARSFWWIITSSEGSFMPATTNSFKYATCMGQSYSLWLYSRSYQTATKDFRFVSNQIAHYRGPVWCCFTFDYQHWKLETECCFGLNRLQRSLISLITRHKWKGSTRLAQSWQNSTTLCPWLLRSGLQMPASSRTWTLAASMPV